MSKRRQFLPSLRSPLALLMKSWLRLKFHLLQKHRMNRPVTETVHGIRVQVLPGVINPRIFLTGAFFVRTLQSHPLPDTAAVLDLGTGTGCCALEAARQGARVTAVDINPDAVRCAEINVRMHGLEDRIQVVHGDLFGPVSGMQFHRILFNPPFFRGEPQSGFSQAWYYDHLPRRFAEALADFLHPGGSALLLLSSLGDCSAYLRELQTRGYRLSVIAEKDIWCEIMTVYNVARPLSDVETGGE